MYQKFYVDDKVVITKGRYKNITGTIKDMWSCNSRKLYQVLLSNEVDTLNFYSYEIEPYREKKQEPQKNTLHVQLVKFRPEDVVVTKNDLLRDRWRDLCNDYLRAFCTKHNYKYEPDAWIADEPGTTIEVCDMFVGMDDIRFDIDHKIPESNFEKWYWKSLEVYEVTEVEYMSYRDFCEGKKDIWDDKRLREFKDRKDKIANMEEDLKKEIEEYKKNKF